MPIDRLPDYELDDRRVVTEPAELKALADPLRATLLELLLERAASVTELAAAVDRPKSTVAHHVNVLHEAGLVVVVRTRRVRAVEERSWGRTARVFAIGVVAPEDVSPVPWTNPFSDAAAESHASYLADTMWANGRHARISRADAREFWTRAEALLAEFAQLPRDGDTVFGLMVGLYPTDFPRLPDVED